MSQNPLIPRSDSQSDPVEDPAVQLIRSKVERAYGSEPDAAKEMAEAAAQRTPSKHQRYMQKLSASGKSLAEIQTEWHHYYTTLSDAEKHEVWQEFYAANQHTPYQKLFQKQQPVASRQQLALPQAAPQQPIPEQPEPSASGVVVASHEPVEELEPKPRSSRSRKRPIADREAVRQLKTKVAQKVNANGKLQLKHHIQSLAFGLASGFIVLVVLLFGFFNEYIIAPFIQPSRTVSATPIILTNNSTDPNAPPSVTIPKINVQIPIDFTVTTTDETAVENGLKGGVVHYANTAMPGQDGNGAYFGHSAVNIFNNGVKYKFAFSLLHRLTTGDLFYITYSGQTYAYQVFAREIVPPSDVGVINDTKGKTATATLITCDPPGVSTNRLVVWGEQISPNISTNTAATQSTAAAPTAIAGNGPNAWTQFVGWLEFWN